MLNKNLENNSLFTQLQLETERLIIRPYKIQDLDELLYAVSDPNFYDHIPGEVTPTINELEGIIKWSIDCNHKNSVNKIYKLNMAIVYKESKKVIGFCGLGPYDLDSSKIEIYYGISKEFQGKGIATEAAKVVLNFGFEILNFDEIVTTVFRDNLASIKVLHKLGMKYQYTLENLTEKEKDFEGFDYYKISKQEFKRNY